MSKIYAPTSGPDDWKQFLADPEKQWRKGFSARATAHCWEAGKGLPDEVKALFTGSRIDAFKAIELVLAIPEHKVPLPPPGAHPSQNDVFALVKATDGGLIAIAVEAKVSEPFGPTFDDWYSNPSPGKTERQEFLRARTGLDEKDIGPIRYQLIHRLASAIIEAGRFNATYAALVVHSFSQKAEWFEDFSAFLTLYERTGGIGQLVELGEFHGIRTFAGWATGAQNFLDA
jgi:hypothetical protein